MKTDKVTSKKTTPKTKKIGIKPALAESKNPLLREERLKGIPAAAGIAIGTAVVLQQETITPTKTTIPPEMADEEIRRFFTAVERATEELEDIIEKARSTAPTAVPILEAQFLMLNDVVINEQIQERIKNGESADCAITQEYDAQEQILKLASDQILRERVIDLENVKQRLLAVLRDRKISHDLPPDSIVVAASLTPTEIILFNESGMLSFVTELSGIASHASILARSMHLPCVIGLRNVRDSISHGATIIVDGYAGEIICNPKPETIVHYLNLKEEFEIRKKKLGKLAKLPSETRDGKRVHLFANVDTPEDIDEAVAAGAEGIGLVRTELLILKLQHFPSEEEQVAWYTQLAERAYPLPITLRVFDIGADKALDSMPAEPNPALGLRGLRFLMKRTDIFQTQIRAALRASVHKNVRILIPMVSGVGELARTRAFIEKCKVSLIRDGIPFDGNTPVGVMIETPSAALMAYELAAEADFFSIGTNDLTQYTLAADRMNELVTDIFDAFHPAVLRLIKMTVEAAQQRNIPVAVCGEMAGHSAATELLIGLGVDELSAVPSLLLEMKNRVRSCSYSQSALLANQVLHLTSGTEIRKRISATNKL